MDCERDAQVPEQRAVLAVSDIALTLSETDGDLSELTLLYRGPGEFAPEDEWGRFALPDSAVAQLVETLTRPVVQRLIGRLAGLARGREAERLADALTVLVDLADSPELKYRDLAPVLDMLRDLLGASGSPADAS